MRQALHILKKDVRHLWIEIAVVLIATGLLVFIDTPRAFWLSNAPLPQTVGATLVSYLLPVAWWILIVRAVHAETLTGDREFWQTRPYSWRSLLAAKALLVALFVNLPMLAAQAMIVQQQGFSLSAEIPSLLWNQVLLTVVFVLPVAAIAALTTGIIQFVVMVLVLFVSLMLLSMRFMMFAAAFVGGGWRAMEWIRTYYDLLVIAIGAAAALLWQYARRRTLGARVLAAGVAMVLAAGAPISWAAGFGIQSRLSRRAVAESAIRVGYNSKLEFTTRALIDRNQRVNLHIPLQLAGIADDVMVKTEGLVATIEGAGGAVWRADDHPWANAGSTGRLIALQTMVDESFYEKVKDQSVRVRGYLYVTLYGNPQVTKVPFGDRTVPVPGMGICAASAVPGAPYFLTCRSAFRPEADLVSVSFSASPDVVDYSPRRPISYSPFPAELSIDPVTPYVAYSTFKAPAPDAIQGRPLDAVTVEALEPVAHVRAPLTIDGLRLAQFEARLK
ncbi:MAG TPA: hypothetical protein VLY04_19125 [Bryobacteraceae bacterium]|nr:hypothetical protein [Bryobacteraceae bacterium]